MNEAALDVRVPARDGFELAASSYAARGGPPAAVVLVNSATAVKRQYYGAYASFLSASGFAVVTYDYRGIGESRPPKMRGFGALMSQWGEQDLAGMISWIGESFPGLPLLAVGHSVGGQIVGLAPNNDRIQALLGVAAQNGYWRHWPIPSRYLMMLYWYSLFPVTARLMGYIPGWLGIGEDLPGSVAIEWARWGRARDYLLSEDGDARRAGFERFAGPLLALSFSDDAYAPRTAVEALLTLYPNARRAHRHVTPAEAGAVEIGHFGFFKERFRDTLWAESVEWLRSGATGSP